MQALAIDSIKPARTYINAAVGIATVTSAAVAKNCTSCHLRRQCLPGELVENDLDAIGGLIANRRRVKRGETLYRAGDPFKWLYAIRSGCAKSYATTEDGREQVTGFQMVGEILGFDGVETEHHTLSAVALEDGEICVFSFSELADASSHMSAFRNQLFRMMAGEIVRDQGLMMLLGNMRAEERLASFLLNLSKRYAARGYSSLEFVLRMTRDEIGSYLGMKLETVSRTFSHLQSLGLISVHQRSIRLTDRPGLMALLNH